ncbi:hypothetical protein M406DRAFT_254750 [Cryphonectria parasitica EP155]|uniref:Uncharacterized protein n=1 Tax=Cryphonectria parasitica (strain ATCC 38755 / EP155) TaxID=660469 RepID=A0A9P4Y682_CRYP1|nr:uncharacterized protein M406DRAFT_254750 [Cryphonectria parasitica EP155]KAF3767246.1 hypothetical protein M406DRAFT_254750 [Cryphonectria parasitica EP155]
MGGAIFFPTGFVAVILSLVSGYALTQSLTSIANIKKYEEKAEKAAEWSGTAEKRLWDTRYTIGTGFVSCLVSLSTAVAYCIFVPGGSGVLAAPWRTLWPALLGVVLRFGSAKYMQDFWATKAKMPMLDQYNAAISQSMDVIGFLDVLSVGWGIMAVLKLLRL